MVFVMYEGISKMKLSKCLFCFSQNMLHSWDIKIQCGVLQACPPAYMEGGVLKSEDCVVINTGLVANGVNTTATIPGL